MADGESDLETDRLELELETLYIYSNDNCSVQSKEYCYEFCKLVEEHTERWQVPLPQLKVLRTALTCFTRATASYPDDCQHVSYALSSLALSFFELMLFFGKEEFQEAPLKDILASFQACHCRLLRHRNIYLLQVRQVLKDGGPWERPTLQAILKDATVTQTEVETYLSSEKPVFFELRVRYLQACERVQEAMALAKSCMEHPVVGRLLFFHHAYLTCLCKASLHEHLHKQIAELDGRDAVEIICYTESQEKDELLLSLCKAFLSQQLHNGDMYYIWDLVFLWSRLYFRANPSKQGFLCECRQLMLSAFKARAIFPFIKVITTEMGNEGVPLCVELCATALQTDLQSNLQADPVTRCLLCKTIAFLLPSDLEVCRLCALLVFCLERSVEAYKTVYLLYTHPDEEPHPHHTPVRTNIRFYILQVLKEGLYFDPEFWNLLTLRTHCLELITDKAMRDALTELREEEELEQVEEEWIPSYWMEEETCRIHTDASQLHLNSNTAPESFQTIDLVSEEGEGGDFPLRRRMKRRWRRRTGCRSDVDPDVNFALKHKHSCENSTKPQSRQREYLARHVKNKILKRRGRKPRRLLLELTRQIENSSQRGNMVDGREGFREHCIEGTRDKGEYKSESGEGKGERKKRGRKKLDKGEQRQIRKGKRPYRRTIPGMELSFPENEVPVDQEVVENSLVTSVSVKQQHSESDKYVNMGQPNGVYVERPFKCYTEINVQPFVLEPSVIKSLHRDHSVLELLEPKPAVVEHLEVEPAVVEHLEVEPAVVEHLEVEPAVVEHLEVEPAVVEHLEVEPAVVEHLEVEPAVVEHLEVEPAVVEHLEVEPAIIEHLEVEPAIVEHLEVKPAIVEHLEVEPAVVEHLEVEPAVVEHLEVEPAVVEHLEVEPAVVDTLKIEPREVECSDVMPMVVKSSVVEYFDVKPSDLKIFEGPSLLTDPELDGPALEMEECPLKLFHMYSKPFEEVDAKELTLTEGDIMAIEVGQEPHTEDVDPVPDKASVCSKHLRFHCNHCQKLFKGGNVVRHTLAHLKLRPTWLSCVFCGKHFQQYNHAKGHVLEHIAELRTSMLSSKAKRAVNGDTKLMEKVDRETKPSDNVTDLLSLTDQLSKPGRGKVKAVVNKQSRIIQNLRNLIKKTKNLNCRKDTDGQQGEVKDEQVTVKDNVVIIRDVKTENERQGDEEEKVKHKQFHLCPAEGCDSIFTRIGPSLLRHAANYHIGDSAVLEKTFLWGKGKCMICQRVLLVFEHYRDHMTIHNAPLKQLCPHMNCGQRFKTAQELKDHMATHQPLQAPCGFLGCGKIFCATPALHEHEWRHYTEPISKEEPVVSKGLSPDGEAPWKKRVKSQDVTVHGWRGQRETPTPKSRQSDLQEKCIYCTRYLWNHLHLVDHMKLHDAPLKQVCLHLNCGQRFSTPQQLWEHMDTHRPLQALCGHAGCGLTFPRIPALHDHEWRHYTKDKPTELSVKDTFEWDTNGNDCQMETSDTVSATAPTHQTTPKPVNGCGAEDNRDQAPEPAKPATSQITTHTLPPARSLQVLNESMNMRESDNILTMAQVMPGCEEPVIAEHKTFKPEDLSYLPLAKAPLIRPPPSTYLTEAALSMRKRRKPADTTADKLAKKSKAAVKKSVPGKKYVTEKVVVEKEAPPQRQRCSKCFTSFSSPEELEKHLTLNTCSSLFSFDSDDDS